MTNVRIPVEKPELAANAGAKYLVITTKHHDRYNADLANAFGNLASRALSMIEKYCDGIVPAAVATTLAQPAGSVRVVTSTPSTPRLSVLEITETVA